MTDAKLTDSATYFSGVSFFPDDMWALISQHLTPQEINRLKQTTKYMAKVATSEQMMGMVLQPLLNRLNKIGAEISNVNINNTNILAAVLEGIKRINNKQIKEAEYLAMKHCELKEKLNTILTPTNNISLLEERNAELDNTNTKLILSKISDDSRTDLHLMSFGITRFPESLMQIKMLQDKNYWEKLKKLNCVGNQLTALPNLNTFASLQTLYCSNNKLTTLPALNACSALQDLYCCNNKLKALPKLDTCTALKTLSCYNNQLRILPRLDACIGLTNLNCAKNNLITLPNLKACPNLTHLNCSNNQLTFLSQDLANKGFTLDYQAPPTRSTLLTPAFTRQKNQVIFTEDLYVLSGNQFIALR